MDIAEPLPRSSPLRATTATLAGTAVGVSMVGVGVYLLEYYGAVLFLASPLAMGSTASVIFNRPSSGTPGQTAAVSLAPLGVVSVVLVSFALEGLLCLVMVLPLAMPLALLGGLVGGRLADRNRASLLLGLVMLPAAAGVEAARPVDISLREVLSVVEIDAPPAQVWRHVVEFAPLDEPTEWWFRAGLAYPRFASIEGEGVGAVRYCVFSTGPFVEPITAWEPDRRLAFDVADAPPPLIELSPYTEVHAPHLDGFFRSRRGEFRLIPVAGGRTRLEGRTWYELDMAPAWYWDRVVELIVHSIHGRVLDHIRQEAER